MGTTKAIHKAADKTYDTMQRISDSVPKVDRALDNINEIISDFKGPPGHLTKTAEKFGSVVKIGIGMSTLKFCSDLGLSCYQSIRLIGIANEAKNDLKKLSDNTIKTEDEVINVLKNTSGDLKSSAGQFTEDVHKMGQSFGRMSAEISDSANQASQDFGHMTESISQSSAEISGSAKQASRNFGYMTHVTSDFLAYFSQDMHQTSRSFRVTCFSLTACALAATMNSIASLQNSSCDQDKESMLCIAPLKSMAAAAITAGFLAIRMLMPNRVQRQMHQNNEITNVMNRPNQALKEDIDLNFLIPEEGVDQNFEWTEEQLYSIKTTNFAVFKHIEIKRQFGGKWHKQELEWLLNQDKNIFFNMIINRIQATSVQVQLKQSLDLNFLIPEEGFDQDVEWTQEELDSIKATNFAVFKHIEIKRQFGGKWHKQELEWLLNQDKSIFLKVLLSGVKQPHMTLNNN